MLKQVFDRFLKKRQAGSQISTAWPFGGIAPLSGNITGLATTRRCISLYSQFLSLLDLETEDGSNEHYFIKLLEKPHPAFKKSDFMEALAWEVLLNGQFICRLIFDRQSGRIKRIDPYRNNTARAYVKKGDYNDPESVAQGFYYRSNYSGKVFWPDEALHIKDNLQFRGDLVNAYPRSFFYKALFDSGVAVMNATQGLSMSGGRGAVMIEGVPMSDNEQDKKVRDNFQKTLQSGLKESTSQVMAMPAGYKVHRLLAEQSHSMITWLAERSDLELAKLWDVPFEILQVGKIGAQSLKEVWRQWIRINLRAFVSKVADAFSESVNDGTKFVFRVGKLRFSDQREAATYFSSLIQNEVLTPEEAKKLLEEALNG